MNKRRRGSDHTLLIFCLALFIFNSPVNIWWATATLPWFAMYIPWLVIVILMILNLLRQDHGD